MCIFIHTARLSLCLGTNVKCGVAYSEIVRVTYVLMSQCVVHPRLTFQFGLCISWLYIACRKGFLFHAS